MSPNTFFQISHRVSHFCQWWRYIIQHLIIIKKKLKNLFFLKRDGHVGVYLFGGLWLNSWPFIQTTYSNVIISSSQKNMSFRGGGAKKKRSGFSWHADIVATPHQSEIFCSNQGDSVNFFCGATARKVNVVIGTGSTCRGESGFFSLQVCSSCGQSHKEQPTWIVCPLRIGNLWRSCIYLGMPPRNHTASQQVHDHNRVGIKFGNNYNY
jgi:hypothetical protein